ncbi:MAG TPA: orotate phosphoribosyltransferase [Phycisphaerales bacterium]|nr:orotate phosphoribosyltransferase [Phycisphaerales bacterium]
MPDADTSAVIQILTDCGALRTGHFQLSSGLHSDRYCQCATLFERPEIGWKIAHLMAAQLPSDLRADTVLAPALGGVLWGYDLARAVGARSLFAERGAAIGDQFALRRGFSLAPGERVLLAEDVVTTGGSVMELVPLVEGAGAVVVGFAAVADRSGGKFRPAQPFFSLVKLDFQTWQPSACPLCRQGKPIDKPGSRKSPASPLAPERSVSA